MSDRAIARTVGILFLLAWVVAIVGGALLAPVDDAEPAADLAAADAQVVTGALLEVLLVLCVVGIAALAYPVLARRDPGLAMGYVGARVVEATLILAAAVSGLTAVALTRDGSAVAADEAPGLVHFLSEARGVTYLWGTILFLGIGATLLNAMLLRARLVPVWLAAWGLAGAVLLVGPGVVATYAELSDAVESALAAPFALSELVLGIWLVVRGFSAANSSSTAATPRAGR